GAAEVADHEGVRTPERVDPHSLDVVDVEQYGADVAEQAHAAAVGGNLDGLVRVRSDEPHLVVAALALDHIVPVAFGPAESVVTGTEKHEVVARAAGHRIVALAADERVGALASDDRVVARAAVNRQADHA